MYIHVCTQVMYYFVGSHLWIIFIFSSSLGIPLACSRRNNPHTLSIIKKPKQTAGRYIQYRKHIDNYMHLGMYSGNVLYCRFSFIDQLDFKRIFERALFRFLRYSSCTLKKITTKTAGRYIKESTHINNQIHLDMYLGNVLQCRSSFMDQLAFNRIFERGLLPFSTL